MRKALIYLGNKLFFQLTAMICAIRYCLLEAVIVEDSCKIMVAVDMERINATVRTLLYA